MTSPSAERLLLILCASLSRSPVAPVRDRRSEPARSTRFNTPRIGPPEPSVPVNFKVNTMCDRDEWSFIFVLCVVRAATALDTSDAACAAESTVTAARCVTVVSPVFGSCFTSCFTCWSDSDEEVFSFDEEGASRSLISSL